VEQGTSRREPDDLEAAVRERTAALLPVVLAASMAVLVFTTFNAWLHRHERYVGWWSYELGFAATIAAEALRRGRHVRAAGIVLSLGFWTLASLAILLLGGPASPGTFLLVPVILTAALFWSWTAAAVLAACSAVLVLVTASLGAAGQLPASTETTSLATLAGVCSGCLAITVVLSRALLRGLRSAVDDAQKRGRELLAMFRESPDAIVVLDDTGIVVDVNPAGLQLASLREVDVVGRHFADLGVLSPGDAAVAIRRFHGLLRGAGRTFPLRLTRSHESLFWGEARARVVLDGGGAKRVHVTIRDATRRKVAEQRRAELEGHLLRLARFETIGRLSGAVAHDVNNMLSVVALVAESLKPRLPPEDQELADELVDSAARASKLNRRLLLVGRRDAVKRTPVDVNVVIQGMRKLLERMTGGSLDVALELDGQPCVVRGDAAQLEQMIINLAANARDATPGHGRLTIATRLSRGGATSGAAKNAVVVRVSDTGLGMDSETQSRIFEPFFTTKGQSGTGLGLATVREIVLALGGEIQVSSQPGVGTEFEIVIPGAPEATELEARAGGASPRLDRASVSG
jgi:two-component system, cell cycle sensor histidine kinase and response regulator CckA